MSKSKQKTLTGGNLEDFKKGERMFEQLAEMFFRPIIGLTMWKDAITQEQRERIRTERMKQIEELNGEPITEATDYEALVYLMTVSLAQPLSSMWSRIYYSLFKKFYPDKSDFIPENEAYLDIQSKPALRRLKQRLYKQSVKR